MLSKWQCYRIVEVRDDTKVTEECFLLLRLQVKHFSGNGQNCKGAIWGSQLTFPRGREEGRNFEKENMKPDFTSPWTTGKLGDAF